jgi:antitoxin (DNA-binding transcriptional repressor) of toxin-antitoxin stability system
MENTMLSVNVYKAKTSFSKLIASIETGEVHEITIARNGKPVARLLPLEPESIKRIGVAKGKFRAPADIDRDNAKVLSLFTGAIDK